MNADNLKGKQALAGLRQAADILSATPSAVLWGEGDDVTTPGPGERFSTRGMFLIAGFATAAWAALVPFAKANAGIDDGTLGLLLLCLGGGALVAMPVAGALTTRYGCRAMLIVAILLVCAMLPLLAVIPNVGWLAATLLAFGIGIGTTDCVMNVQAILVEKAAGKPMMSGFHGLYSIGGIVGATAMSGMMSAGLSPLHSCGVIVMGILLLLGASRRGLLPYANPSEGPAFAVPRGTVLILGAVCFVVFMAEGAVLDWSAVFLTEYRDMPNAQGGLGFACFAAAMTLGRLTGDKVISRLGARFVVTLGAVIATLGILLAVALPAWPMTLCGYALIGLGCANIVPVMFSAIGRQRSMPQAVAVPAVTTMGYTGVLAGPASIGFIAHHSSLPIAFIVVGCLLVVVAVLYRTIKE